MAETPADGRSNRTEPDPDRDGATGRFKPGNNANPGGRPKGARSLTAILREILDARVDPKNPDDLRTEGDVLMAAALGHAKEGNASYFKEIIERLDGKVPERVVPDFGPDFEFVFDESAPTDEQSTPPAPGEQEGAA
jgi:hypothetical protein